MPTLLFCLWRGIVFINYDNIRIIKFGFEWNTFDTNFENKLSSCQLHFIHVCRGSVCIYDNIKILNLVLISYWTKRSDTNFEYETPRMILIPSLLLHIWRGIVFINYDEASRSLKSINQGNTPGNVSGNFKLTFSWIQTSMKWYLFCYKVKIYYVKHLNCAWAAAFIFDWQMDVLEKQFIIISNTSHKLYTWLCCGLVLIQYTHILQGYFTGTGAIIGLPQCQWRNPEGYG